MIEAFLRHFTETLSKKAAGQLFDKYLRNGLIDIWWDDRTGTYVVTMIERPYDAIGNSCDADELSVAAAAAICGKSQTTIRNWVPHVGRFDPRLHRFIISKARLAAYLRKRFGHVPNELEG
jgi:hypothetical protein